MKKKIEVKPKSWQLDGYNGKITFSVKTTHLLTPQNHTELLTRIGNMIANELENDELLKENPQQ